MARDGDIGAAGDAEDDGVISLEGEGAGASERRGRDVKKKENKTLFFHFCFLLTLFYFFHSKVTKCAFVF